MNEFFNSIWTWLVIRHDSIIGFLCSAQFAGIVAVIINIVRTKKTDKINAERTGKLIDSLDKNNVVSEIIEETKEKIGHANNAINLFASAANDKLAEMTDVVNEVQRKLNAVLEVQSVAYSTVKDERIRSSVNSIITGAKFADNSTKVELQNQIEELKKQLEAANEQMRTAAENAIKETSKILGTVVEDTTGTTSSTPPARY